jgi:proline iminopeptidase
MRTVILAMCLWLVTVPAHAQDVPGHPPGDFARSGQTSLWFETEGSGEPLLLIGGGPGLSHAYFHPWFSPLNDQFRVVYFDAYGTGRSSKAAEHSGYSLAQAVEHIEVLRKALKVDRLNVLGHSYGGYVALGYATKYPSHVKALAISGIVASGAEQQLIQDNLNAAFRRHAPEAWAGLQALRAKGLVSSSSAHAELYEPPSQGMNFYNPENAGRLRHDGPNFYNPDLWYGMAGTDADFTVAGELRQTDFRQSARRLPMPFLVIGGRYDRLVYPALIERWRTYAPKAQVVILERSGHFPFLEEQDGTLAILRAFFSTGRAS